MKFFAIILFLIGLEIIFQEQFILIVDLLYKIHPAIPVAMIVLGFILAIIPENK